MSSFNDFRLQPTTLSVLDSMHITEPTPIQTEAIPALLAGKDLIGQSATGSGKTLAYGIPLAERISGKRRETQALVLVPTRELAMQVYAVLNKLAASRRLTMALLVGGRPYGTQISALRFGAQIVVGTPGRIKDHLDRGSLNLNHLRMCVLDEADQMLDSGFAPAIEEILTTTPEGRQTALFSATMPDWIKKLQEKFLNDPIKITITPPTFEESTIEQIAYQVPQEHKIAALSTLLHSTEGESTLIFGRTKYGVEKLGKQLSKLGFTVGTLHGNKSQRAREEVLSAFRRGQVQTLLATNVAARGLDIHGIAQVINYELPESSELFTHRIGRTGRMGRQGKAITLLAPADVAKWRRMARNLGQAISLQRLVLEDPSLNMQAVPVPEFGESEELESYREPREQNRPQFSSTQRRDRRSRPEYSSPKRNFGAPKRSPESDPYRTPVSRPEWESDDFLVFDHPYSGKTRTGRREATSQPRSGNYRGKGTRNISSFEEAAPQHRPDRKKSGAPSTSRPRQAATSNRSFSRPQAPRRASAR